MDRRRVDPRHPVGDAHIASATGLGRFHHANDFGEEGIVRARQRLDLQCARQVEGAGLDSGARRDGEGRALAGDERAVEFAPARENHSINRHPLAGGDAQDHAGLHLVEGHVAGFAIGEQRRAACGQSRDGDDGAAGALAHALVEIPAHQQEEDQRHGRVEIGFGAAVQALIKAHGQGQEDGERNRDVHVQAPDPQRRDRRAEEGLAGEGHGRHRDQRRDEMEEVPRRGVGPGPDGDRQEHDVGGPEAGDRQRRQQSGRFPPGANGFQVAEIDGRARIAERVQCAGDDRRRDFGGACDHGHPAQGEVDPNRGDAGQGLETGFDGRQAGAAANAGHRQDIGHRAVRGLPPGMAQFLGPRVDGKREGGAAAAHGRALT